ncbi:hypothetical protein [Leekyejoonella antrihumi]|uniref:Uncharacterized protein n=1 Tax=Leekyejoonella antrihumi TaxID=1660198 RepID=A0A563DW23_9MICO|nr:hypothetical protein [Leekyejoonella antrihumi]TWP34480.1 hypothetical protein FGL98_17350 [Leekyejoonella antrihumi]
MSADEFEAWRSEQQEDELEIREDRQQQRIGTCEDAVAARSDIVGTTEAQWVLDEGWPTGADAPNHDLGARWTGRSR